MKTVDQTPSHIVDYIILKRKKCTWVSNARLQRSYPLHVTLQPTTAKEALGESEVGVKRITEAHVG